MKFFPFFGIEVRVAQVAFQAVEYEFDGSLNSFSPFLFHTACLYQYNTKPPTVRKGWVVDGDLHGRGSSVFKGSGSKVAFA